MSWLIELEFKPQNKWITSIKLRNMSMTYQWMTEGQVGSLVFVVAGPHSHIWSHQAQGGKSSLCPVPESVSPGATVSTVMAS